MFIWHLFQNIRKMVQTLHMLAEPEYTINFTQRRTLQSVLSVPGQKSSKHTLLLVEDVNSPASQRSPPKQRSLFITEVNSSLHTAHRGKVKNSSNMLSLFYRRVSLLPTQFSIGRWRPLALWFLCLIAKSSLKFSIFQQSFVSSPLLVQADWRGSDGQMVSVSGAFVKLTLCLCSEWENNKRSK